MTNHPLPKKDKDYLVFISFTPQRIYIKAKNKKEAKAIAILDINEKAASFYIDSATAYTDDEIKKDNDWKGSGTTYN
ncbi:MAG: hypothetical protein C5B59_08090 [Bacteroidetes bacterium]|nr:MAG: hypothetical protein C5B59_08090 [Bacteroidota bacterium]